MWVPKQTLSVSVFQIHDHFVLFFCCPDFLKSIYAKEQIWAGTLNIAYASSCIEQPVHILFVRQTGHIEHQHGSILQRTLIGYVHNVTLWKQVHACVISTHMTHWFFFRLSSSSLLLPFLSCPVSLYLSFTASQNILFLSMAEFRADKGVEGSGGSDIMGFSCQIGSKSSL